MDFLFKSMQLENFKCFKKTNEIKFKKLTLLTGANSAGKSTIIHALMGVLQSRAFPFRFSTNGTYVNMGDFKDVSHQHSIKENLFLTYKFFTPKENINALIKTGWEQNKKSKLPLLNSISFKSEFLEVDMHKKGTKYILNLEYKAEKDPEATAERKNLVGKIMSIFEELDSSKEKSDSTNKKKGKTGSKKAAFKEVTDYYFADLSIKDMVISMDEANDLIIEDRNLGVKFESIGRIFQRFDERTNLISSFRLHPNRTHLEQSQDFSKIRKFGEGHIEQIIRWEKGDKKKFEELIKHLSDLTLLYSIETDRMGGGRYDMLVTTKPKGVKVSLSDVGFGISQFLPILVADLQLSKGSNLVVAQPEIHLHPNVQARFGDYMVDQIEKNDKNYIIETHSEYLLNRIRLHIVNGKLKEEDLAVYYVENEHGNSTIHELQFTKKGEIKNAPESFFDTYMMDLENIAFSAEL
jgi:predicted ATPase